MQQLFTTPGHISKKISFESAYPTIPNDLVSLVLHFPPSGFLITGAFYFSGSATTFGVSVFAASPVFSAVVLVYSAVVLVSSALVLTVFVASAGFTSVVVEASTLFGVDATSAETIY